MPTEDELFSAVDALLEVVAQDELPEPAERRRLREAAGLSQAQIATAMGTRREAVGNWESGRTEPRPPQRAAYARLLEGLATRFPAPAPAPGLIATASVPATATAPAPEAETQAPERPVPATLARPAARDETVPARAVSTGMPSDAAPAAGRNTPRRPAPTAKSRPADAAGPSPVSRRPAERKATAKPLASAAAVDPRFAHGPLAVVDVEDGQVSAYCVDGLVLDVPAKSLPALVDWTLTEAKLGQTKLTGPGKDADPLLVLTGAACERYGLPLHLTDEERLAGRLPEDHKAVEQLARAEWKLTKRGFGPWARIYRPARGSERMCVQLCVLSWDALDTRHWGAAAQLAGGGTRRTPGHVRVQGDDAPRLHRGDRPGADDRSAPADPRLRAGRGRQAAQRAQPRQPG